MPIDFIYFGLFANCLPLHKTYIFRNPLRHRLKIHKY